MPLKYFYTNKKLRSILNQNSKANISLAGAQDTL